MLSDTLNRVPRGAGLQLLQRRGDRGARELTSWRLMLGPGASEHYVSPDEETVVVLQQGSGACEVGTDRWPIARADVFTDRATAVYRQPGHRLTVHADTPLEARLISTPPPAGGAPALIRPDDVQPVTR